LKDLGVVGKVIKGKKKGEVVPILNYAMKWM
jgi:hypothetical protein